MTTKTRSARLAGVAGLCVSITAGFAVGRDGARMGVVPPAGVVNHAAHCTQCNHGAGLPTYDIRVDDAVYGAIATSFNSRNW